MVWADEAGQAMSTPDDRNEGGEPMDGGFQTADTLPLRPSTGSSPSPVPHHQGMVRLLRHGKPPPWALGTTPARRTPPT